MDVSGREGPVVAGVFPGQRAAVVTEAAALARLIDRPLLCVYVAPDTFLTEWDRADVRVAASLHPTDIGAADGQAAMQLSCRDHDDPAEHGGAPAGLDAPHPRG